MFTAVEQSSAGSVPNAGEWPTVSFDIGLGKLVKSIDFDHEAYARYMRLNGLTGKQIASTSIRLRAKGVYNPIAGVYDPYDNDISVGISKNDSAIDTNATLAHETQHRIDDARGQLGGIPGTIDKIQNGMFLYGLGAQALGVAMWYGNRLVHGAEHASWFTNLFGAAQAVGLVTMVGAGIIYFGISPSERSARAAERKPPHIVSMKLRARS